MAKPKKETARQRQMRLRKMKNDMASSNRRLPGAGQSGGSQPPRGTSAPQDRRPRPDRRTAAQQKLKQAQQGTRTSTTRTGTPGKPGALSGYRDDIRSLKNMPKKLLALLKKRGGAGAAAALGTGLGLKIFGSRGKEGGANMSILGGNAPTYGKGKKTKGRTL